jgi:hypothetical protein
MSTSQVYGLRISIIDDMELKCMKVELQSLIFLKICQFVLKLSEDTNGHLEKYKYTYPLALAHKYMGLTQEVLITWVFIIYFPAYMQPNH